MKFVVPADFRFLVLGASRCAPTIKPKPLGRLIGAFKTVSTKQINQLRMTPGRRLCQRNYYEHVVRNEEQPDRIRRYIIDNPLTWETDPENSAAETVDDKEPWEN